jgi:hypothetical protein
MVSILLKNSKKILKAIPQNIFVSPSKSAVYIGLTVYWIIIILGTFFQI